MEEAAIVECESRKPGRESCMRKIRTSTHAAPVRTAPTRGGEACASASAHPAPVCAAEMRASAHAAEMHSAATEVPTSEAAAMAATATASESWSRKSKRCAKHARDEAIKKLVTHPVPP